MKLTGVELVPFLWNKLDIQSPPLAKQKDLSAIIDTYGHELLVAGASLRDRARFKAIARPKAGAWLSSLPIPALNFHCLSEYRIIIRRRLGIPILYKDTKCTACNLLSDIHADQMLRCKKKGDKITRHNNVRNLIADLSTNAALAPVLEKSEFQAISRIPSCRCYSDPPIF